MNSIWIKKLHMNKIYNRRGIAIVMVIGLVAIIVPVLYLLSQMGTSQTKLAFKYHENLLTETTAFSGSNAGISRLRGNLRGYQNLTNQLVGDESYSLNLRPTGKGFFQQDLYYMLASSKIKSHNYAIMAEAEQFNPEPDPPVLVISRDFWNTVEPYEIDQVADVLSMQNDRGVDLLRLDETRDYEKNATPTQYSKEIQAKSSRLPEELIPDWPEIVDNLTSEKLSM
ncbi:MAG: hypothetical protein A2W80_05175 [Candidatus Riflebacteria bacterium GWC2_50_8]|nr:MAG: hypothetical protein A2W80_05175 [Candidatus Riflebacteria bacterium GWC2_50_8]